MPIDPTLLVKAVLSPPTDPVNIHFNSSHFRMFVYAPGMGFFEYLTTADLGNSLEGASALSPCSKSKASVLISDRFRLDSKGHSFLSIALFMEWGPSGSRLRKFI